jgi:hypothetical protein
MSEWTELKDLQAVAKAQADGWEIELRHAYGWHIWEGETWKAGWKFRGRPAQLKTRTVTSECWRCKSDGQLIWRSADKASCFNWDAHWQRFPAGDITGEVEE